jgi:DNA-binding transcriptional ArsR family regulator
MSRRSLSAARSLRSSPAPLFAALGDQTRLAIVTKLASGAPRSISQLTEGSKITRQAVTKHLHILETAGVVRSVRSGRENLFVFEPAPMEELRLYLDFVSKQWDEALGRLKKFVEQ